ncbi:MAG: hypothetical protein VCA74_09380 [Deltaproteobacteria bacterium]
METLFAHTYLVLFGKLAVGGLLSLAVPPFTKIERGFYTSSGAIYLAFAWIMLGGLVYLDRLHPESSPVTGASLAVWSLFGVLFSLYYLTLFIELPVLRARLFPAAVVSGFAALVVTAGAYLPTDASAAAWPFLALPFVAGAAISGAALSGMLLGHWYLIDTGLDLAPFKSMLAFCKGCLWVEVAAVVATATVLWLWPGGGWGEGLGMALSGRYGLLVAGRIVAWVGAVLLLRMITRTLAIPQTMAATGLFYIQALVVMGGEIFGHWLLFRTGIPF